MKLIIILLLMLFCHSCQSVHTAVVCSELRAQEIEPLEMCDVSFKFNLCRCRLFDMNSWTPKGEAIDHDIEYCEGIAGYRLVDIAVNVRPKIKAMYRLKENLCANKN